VLLGGPAEETAGRRGEERRWTGRGGPRMDGHMGWSSPSCSARPPFRARFDRPDARIGVAGRAKRLPPSSPPRVLFCFGLLRGVCMCSSAGRGTRLAGVFVRSSSTGWAGTACSFLFRSCESLNDGMGWQMAGRVVPVKRNPNAPCATGPSLQQLSHGPPRRCSPL
jgi:hypothetical protein